MAVGDVKQEYFWALVTLIIAVALAFILVNVVKDDPRTETMPVLQQSAYNNRLDRLDRKGIEAAYANRVALLFQNWMTDTTKDSSARALKGHRNARQVYIDAMTGLDARDPEEGFKLQSDTSSAPFILPVK